MKCSFCDKVFDEDAAEKDCQSCSLFGGCKKIKCPHCGYEMPATPRLVKWLRSKFKGRHD